MEERQTIITLENLSNREIGKKVKVSVSTVFLNHQRLLESGGNSDRKRSDKVTAESEEKFLKVNFGMIDAPQDNNFKNSFIVVFVRICFN